MATITSESEHTVTETIGFWTLIAFAIVGPIAGLLYLRANYFSTAGAICAGLGLWLVCLLLLMGMACSGGSQSKS